MFIYFLIVFILITGVCGNDRPIVKTPNGIVEGSYRKSNNGRQYATFEGIPFAKPPVGDLRFKSPEPIEPWTGIWKADTKYICMHRDHEPSDQLMIYGNEDCLYINVYIPRNNQTNMDVIIHIHGGAFMLGHGGICGPEIIMDHDVVFVSFNYRLGPLGFLATEDDAAPGNYGLKDQSLALKWIKDNIASFGGNLESVTITGLSAGGISVHLHYLSPLSRNLFHRGISLSGTALNNWGIVDKPLENARMLAKAVGCDQNNTYDLIACLKQRPSRQIAKASKVCQPWLYNPFTPFGPVVEPVSADAFLSIQPYEAISKGQVADVPWITSVTKNEGLYPGAEFIYSEDRLPYLEKNWDELAPYVLNYYDTTDKSSWVEVAHKIRERYLDNRQITRETFPKLVQAIGDRLFVAQAEKAARLQANVNKAPVYFSIFDYRGDHSITERFSRSLHNFGVSHADDIFYTIAPNSVGFAKYMKSEDDKKLSDILIKMWISFAHNSQPELPEVTWNTVSKNINDPFRTLYISGPNHMIMKEVNELGFRSFWESLPIKENDKTTKSKDEL